MMNAEREPRPGTQATPPDAEAAPALLRRFLGRLRLGYQRQRATAVAGIETAALDERLTTLLLAEAAVGYVELAAAVAHPLQLAVLGPTQTGKSTVVNLLLGRPLAEVSPLAGFTVHPQGFWMAAAGQATDWLAHLFAGWRRVAPAELTRDDLETYSVSLVDPPAVSATGSLFDPPTVLPPCVLWDTPDFDSLAARQYARGVLECAALADLYVLVLSREKYSDLSVWRLLELLAPLGRPLVIVLNKSTPDAEATLLQSLHERLRERGRAWGDVPVIAVPYDPALPGGDGAAARSAVPALRGAIERLLAARPRGDAARGTRGVWTLLQKHWDAWLGPVHAEAAARAEWRRMVAAAGDGFLAAYTRDYLEHPERYDSFRRATVELLGLLELPRVGGVLARVRQAVTWPARQIVSAGRAWFADRRPRTGTLHSLGAEVAVLLDALDGLLTGLRRDVARRCGPGTPGCAVWQALERKLEQDESALRVGFEAAIRAHHKNVTGEVRAAANRLYAELQKSPARLAALRTARATLDVGGLVLAMKTGGLTPLDAVWAPATFALTSLLMEGVTGLELGREARQLKARQRAAVADGFVAGTLVRTLSGLVDDLDPAGLFNVPTAEMEAATAALRTWERGACGSRAGGPP